MKIGDNINFIPTRQSSLFVLAGVLILIAGWPFSVAGQERNTGSYTSGRAPLDGTKKQVGQSGKALGHELLGKPNLLSLSEYMIHNPYTTFNFDTDPTYKKIVESFFDRPVQLRIGQVDDDVKVVETIGYSPGILVACHEGTCLGAGVDDLSGLYSLQPVEVKKVDLYFLSNPIDSLIIQTMPKIATEISIEQILIQLKNPNLTDEERKKLEELLKKLKAAKEKAQESWANNGPGLTPDQKKQVTELQRQAQEKLQRGDTAGWRQDLYDASNLSNKFEKDNFDERVKNNLVRTNELDGSDGDRSIFPSNPIDPGIFSNIDRRPTGEVKVGDNTVYNYSNGNILNIVTLGNGTVVTYFKDGSKKVVDPDGNVTNFPPGRNPSVVTQGGVKQLDPNGGSETSFWFFDHDNIAMVVKTIDGGTNTEGIWFFSKGLTNVEFEITVTDIPANPHLLGRDISEQFKTIP
ncbi:MAG: hypothetical protein O2999_11550 [Nitrospirae bacterium]|nr:hypothetical protein [Nitrospirota bacterium]MDA1304913.1 hypothetical protein [Nitrospirota bacterium]